MCADGMVLQVHLVLYRHTADFAFDSVTLAEVEEVLPPEVLAQIAGSPKRI